MKLFPLGIIHSSYQSKSEAPRQGRFSQQSARIEIYSRYSDCLKEVEKAKYLIVLYWCDRVRRDTMQTRTPSGPEIKGVFACRSPSRPNPIAFCVAELLSRRGNTLEVRGVEALNGSYLIDIKPYVSEIDSIEDARIE